MSFKRSLFTYVVANLSGAFIAVLLVPILTRYLGPDAFGKSYIFITVVWLANTLCGFSIQAAVTVRYKVVGQRELALMISAAIVLISCLNIVAHVSLLVFPSQLAGMIGLEVRFLHLAVIASFFNVLFMVWQALQMIQGNALSYAIQQFGNTVLNAVLSIAFVVFVSLKLEGRLLAITMCHICMGGWSLIRIWRGGFIVPCIEKQHIIRVSKYGLGMLPHMLGVFLFSGLDRILAAKVLGGGQAGVYMGASALASTFALASTAANRALVPKIYERIDVDPASVGLFISRFAAVTIAIGVIVALISVKLCSPAVEWYLGAEFRGSGSLFAWLILVQFLFLAYTAASNVVMYFERNVILSTVTVSTGLIFVSTFYGFAQLIGIHSIVVALVVGWTVRVAWTYGLALRLLKQSSNRGPGGFKL